MNEDVGFLQKYRTSGAIIDANLLLVYVIGRADRRLLGRSHHTKQYEEDFPIVQRVVEYFARIYTTPNILTEVSNLAAKDGGAKVLDFLAKFVRRLDERYCVSSASCEDQSFTRLGLTDAGLCLLAREYLVVTADFNLHLTLRRRGLDAINFNHLRQASW